ncbi:uncharacterized protein SCHCODRAFT_02484062, partial [Schizophyllum commune H4-8]|uniref:uncharacterized protein n=1 Tax=Schizophyllum commune (strain H4-8 / FGSC 9210) TaxID=578458 RepID=UPI00215E1C6D
RVNSQEIVIYGYNRNDMFVAAGDSGVLVVDSRERMVGVIHAGHSSGLAAYATPA